MEAGQKEREQRKAERVGRSSQILKSNYNPLICDIKEGHKASTQTEFHYL